MTPAELVSHLMSSSHFVELSSCLDDLARRDRHALSPEDQIRWCYIRTLEEVHRAVLYPGVGEALVWLLHDQRLCVLIQASRAGGQSCTHERIRLVTVFVADAIRQKCG